MMRQTHDSTGAHKLKLPNGISHNHMKLYDDEASILSTSSLRAIIEFPEPGIDNANGIAHTDATI